MLIFQTMKSDRPNNLSFKYQMFTPSGCKDIGIKTFEIVPKKHDFSFIAMIKTKSV